MAPLNVVVHLLKGFTVIKSSVDVLAPSVGILLGLRRFLPIELSCGSVFPTLFVFHFSLSVIQPYVLDHLYLEVL